MNKISYRIDELAEATGIGRSVLYRYIAAGQLRTRKAGKITLVDADEAMRFVSSLPSGRPSAAIDA